ncbi:hypothetical protein GUJ93_ZPchr0004g39937 [Zizania palustris]|uniref:Uncharacterized protein n=1 Tax=Zizania palustris TaxID=103762 RepID=A0A8J5VZ91_ZIZPA|nr:hypothetical protein GUJ93_ZPchr0004g39937 [Zizania palustris]
MEGRVASLEEEMTGIKTEIKELKEMFGEMMRLWKGKNSTQDGEKLVAADPRETNTSAAHGREEAEAQQKNGEGRNHVGGRPRGGRPPARTPEELGKCVAVSIVQDTTREKWLEMLRNDPEVQQKVAHLLDQVDGSSAAPESTRPQWEVRDKLVYRGGKLWVPRTSPLIEPMIAAVHDLTHEGGSDVMAGMDRVFIRRHGPPSVHGKAVA